jgi:rhodanese-related sulfurtransferase
MSILSFLFGGKDTPGVTKLNVADFKSGIAQKGVQILDVRTAGEFGSGHIAKAKNLDFFQGSRFKSGLEGLKKDKPVYVYCRSGNRSGKAARMMAAMGFTEIYDLRGGYMAWS